MWRKWYNEINEVQQPSTFQQLLFAAGFRKSSSHKYARILSGLWEDEHIALGDLVDMVIEYALDDRIRTTSDFFIDHVPNERFVHLSMDSKIVHVNCETFKPDMETYVLASQIPQTQRFFHATSWAAAESICEDSPGHDNGRRCLDFGLTRSFYVGESFSDAIDWTHRLSVKFRGECAILVFDIVDFRQDHESMSFPKANREWKRLTQDSRLCGKIQKKNKLDFMDFVHGPMVMNSRAVATFGNDPIPHNPIKMQLASKTNKSDLYLRKHLVAILWKKRS